MGYYWVLVKLRSPSLYGGQNQFSGTFWVSNMDTQNPCKIVIKILTSYKSFLGMPCKEYVIVLLSDYYHFPAKRWCHGSRRRLCQDDAVAVGDIDKFVVVVDESLSHRRLFISANFSCSAVPLQSSVLFFARVFLKILPLLLHLYDIDCRSCANKMFTFTKVSKGRVQKKKSKKSDIVQKGRVGWTPKTYF